MPKDCPRAPRAAHTRPAHARTHRSAYRAALAPPPGLTARATVRTAPPRTARQSRAGRAVCVYVFAGRRLSPGKMVAAAAATKARLRSRTAATALAGRNGGQRWDRDATGAGRPGLGAGLLPRLLPRLLLVLLILLPPPLLLLPWAAEAAAAASAVSGSAAAEAKECDRPCVNGGRCNPGTGQCVCPAGWVGEQCQHCGGRFR